MKQDTNSSILLATLMREQRRLLNSIRRLIGAQAGSEDIVQDAYLRLLERYRKSDDLLHPDHFTGLLYRTARNLAIDHLRNAQVRESYARSMEEQTPEEVTFSTERLVVGAEQLASLAAALQGQPRRAREVFFLNRIERLSYRQIAEHLNISVSLVEKEIMRALRVCRRWREQQDDKP